MVVAATHTAARTQGCGNRRTSPESRAKPTIKSSVFMASVHCPAERDHGPVSRDLQRADARAARRRSLPEGQLLQLEELDRLPLPLRQRSDRVVQRLLVLEALVVGIRCQVGKSYSGIVHVDLARALPGMTPGTVGKTAADNCQHPRHEWAVRVVCRADGVQRQQDVLDQVLDVSRTGKPTAAADDPANTRHEVLQEL